MIDAGARVEAAPYVAAAERFAAGTFDIFALEGIELGRPPALEPRPAHRRRGAAHFGKELD